MSIRRRSFVKGSALLAAASVLPARRVLGANEEIRAAVVGFRGRGGSHIKGLAAIPGVRIAALCDADAEVLNKRADQLEKDGARIERYTDVRKLLESRDIDVISTATPNHWHALISVWAAQAGKDVYVEKPVSHNVWEGRQIVNAARKHNRIIQTGTQSRSSREGIAQAIEWVHAGNLGKIKYALATCYKRRPSIGKLDKPLQIPPNIDYDLWCGPAEKVDLYRPNLHYDWHWDWNTGNGDLGNQGIHQMDVARWFLGEPMLSPRVMSLGGRVGYEDAGNTPNTQIVWHDYDKAPLMFEVRGLETPEHRGAKIGVLVQCEGGHALVNGSSVAIFDKDGKQIQKFSGSEDHFENFIKAVRSRRREDLNADILEGHLSSALCHTGNISYRLGKRMEPQQIAAQIKDNHVLSESYGRMLEHLAANNVDVSGKALTLGPMLQMDPAGETFKGNKEADRLLTRPYRKPYVVPAIAPV